MYDDKRATVAGWWAGQKRMCRATGGGGDHVLGDE